MLLLLIKLTALLLTGLVARFAARKSTAAMRHLLCLLVLTGSLLLPFGSFMRGRALPIPTKLLDAATTSSFALGHGAAFHWSVFLTCAWALGTALLLIRLALGHWRVTRLIASGNAVEPPTILVDITVPMAYGLFRPIVLMPHESAEWPAWQRAAALRHELTHILRKDLWANLGANLACAIYWFHPLVWILALQMRREQEMACDEAVIDSGYDVTTYAEALVGVAARLADAKDVSRMLVPGCSMASQSALKTRVMNLLDGRLRPRTSRRALFTASAAIAAILMAFVALKPVRADQVYHAGGDVTSPSVIYKVDPAYPEDARQERVSGTVVLSLTVGPDGMAHDISIVQHLYPSLDESAIEVLNQWRFAPGTLKGEPVAVKAMIEINFRLR
jgi:TonB family protein